jgi:1-deoxy-D-xylulose-5-phosphate reductoisomerase
MKKQETCSDTAGKKIAILGSTGSIGTQTLDILPDIGGQVVALTANRNIDLLEQQARKFVPKLVAVYDEEQAKILKTRLADTDIAVYSGMEGLLAAATIPEAEVVETAVVGMVGLRPTLAAIHAGKDIALANKETLVCGGALVMAEAAKYGVRILPVDSEHSAIFQCLRGKEGNPYRKLILTASGGPFFGKRREELQHVKPQDALKHPNWSMGAKITIDSATMINKGLEFLEAMWLYDAQPEQIDIVVHRESIVHSMIEFEDGAVIAQMGMPDMRLPIQYALTFPKRYPCKVPPLNLAEIGKLTFYAPDEETFSGISLAKRAAKEKGNTGAVLNGANEQAVALFLQEKIGFLQIADLVAHAMDTVPYQALKTVDDVFASDRQAREAVRQTAFPNA